MQMSMMKRDQHWAVGFKVERGSRGKKDPKTALVVPALASSLEVEGRCLKAAGDCKVTSGGYADTALE